MSNKKLVRESLDEVMAAGEQTKEAPVKEPITKPGTRPGKPSPIRRQRPSVTPRPKLRKASEEDVVAKFKKLVDMDGDK